MVRHSCARIPTATRSSFITKRSGMNAPPELRPALKNQAQRFPARGINVRRLDHWNGLAVDIKANREFFEKYLGFRLTEQIVLDNGVEAAMWMTCTNKSYDFAYTRDAHRNEGPLPSRHLRGQQPRRGAAGRGYFPGEWRLHRNRAAQARHPADIFPVCLRAWGEPRRNRQCRRAPDSGAGLEADSLDRNRTQEGPSLGTEDHRVLPYLRHASSRDRTVILDGRNKLLKMPFEAVGIVANSYA